MQRPSVLFINRVYPPARGASGRVLRDLARAFAREGWQVSVLCAGPRPGTDKDGSIKVVRLGGRGKPMGVFGYAWLWLRLFFAALRQPRPDLIVTLTDPPMMVVAGRILKKIRKTRHIHWCHDVYPDLFPAIEARFPGFLLRMMNKAVRRAMNDADKVIVIGRCMARNLTAKGIDAKKISFIPNWPDMELVRPPKPESAAGASQLNGGKAFEDQIKDGPKFRVLYAGNIGRAHPVDAILDAAAILDEQNPEIEFVFVGDGPKFDLIARERARRGLNNIRLMPFQPQGRLRALMESGDLHLISMNDNAAGLMVPCKFYSSLAVGRPCIYVGPDNSEIAKVINDFKTGAVVANNAPEKIAATIRHYRLNAETWFAAQDGALAAGAVFIPKEAIEAWMQRAWSVVEPDLKNAILAAPSPVNKEAA
jgi:colanic acid biosynthesis glycosyl transferase WcaI